MVSTSGFAASAKQRKLLDVLWDVESSKKTGAVIGDNGKAHGPYQIHQPYWQDSGIGGTFPTVVYDKGNAERCINGYMTRYAKEAWTSEASFNYEKVARIHNGGPSGHTKEATLPYWGKVKSRLGI